MNPLRPNDPYIVDRPGEGRFVISPTLVVKLDGIREVNKWSHKQYGGPAGVDGSHHFLLIVRKTGMRSYHFENRTERDYIFDKIRELIEGPAVPPAGQEPAKP